MPEYLQKTPYGCLILAKNSKNLMTKNPYIKIPDRKGNLKDS